MVKKVSGNSERGKVKVRFFEIEMEGDTEALQESLRSLTSAINKPVSQPQRQLVGGLSTARRISAPTDELEGEIVEESENEFEEPESPIVTPTQLSGGSVLGVLRQRQKFSTISVSIMAIPHGPCSQS